MQEMMKAVVSYAPYDNRYEEVAVPEIGEEEILKVFKTRDAESAPAT